MNTNLESLNQLINQAKSYHQNGNLIEARRLYLQALNLSPNNDDVYNFLGIAYSQLNNHEQSIKCLNKAIEINPNNPEYYISLAETLLIKGDLKQSIKNLYRAIKLNPNLPTAHFNLANTLKLDKKYQGAIEHYREAIMLNPNHLGAHNNLANTYAQHSQYAKAIDSYNNVLRLNPDFIEAKNSLSRVINLLSQENEIINKFKFLDTFSKTDILLDDNKLIANYIDLLKKCLTDTLNLDPDSYEYQELQEGLTWPIYAETMIGIKRMNNLHYCISKVIKNNIAGDFIETGVWRGGATILMRGILEAYDIKDRSVWVADSFDGLPPPNEELYPADKNSSFHTMNPLKISIDDVKDNFRKYNLLDDQVKFLQGWFKDTLPNAPIKKLAVLRLDGDMYESTMDALTSLYPKLSVGGYIIIDDYGAIDVCRQAIHDYRSKYNITEKIELIDNTGVFWQKL